MTAGWTTTAYVTFWLGCLHCDCFELAVLGFVVVINLDVHRCRALLFHARA